ncbi:hypothetical protein OPS25_11740 [Alteromonas ponticola]|uniref:Uncharacterized protein n=1 Tax=Alteromonas aquimaris TaxID=2998417 RepID=A0ABT3P9G9_9ALTE|nr:hypothetical protein [Alteromonas aquimaris]MCW8109170.1 hypothetical protein [Alteromonas aquimaris]
MLIPLVIFIAIAGYQFGYYHAKIDISDAQKVRLSENSNKESPNVLADKVVHKVSAAEIPAQSQKILQTKKTANYSVADETESAPISAGAGGVIDRIEKASAEDADRNKQYDEFVENYRDEDLDMELATQLTDFFSLLPDGQNVYFHHVRCNTSQCQLVGQFDGDHKRFSEMIEELQQQDWYSFGGTSSNINSDKTQTHFILHLTERKTQS